MIDPYVSFVVSEGIGIIEFFHPAHNSLPGHLLQQLKESLENASKDKRVKIILLKSAGDRTFCAGASFEELRNIQDEEEGKKFFSGFGNVINAIRQNNKLLVARVQGKAVGGGVGLIAAADISFATQYASVRLSELHIGIGPFVIGPAVERKMGVYGFSKMCLQPLEWLSPEEAKHAGLFSHVYEDAAQMDQALEVYLKQMSEYNPEALLAMKKMLWENTDHWDELLEERAAMSGKLVLSDFTKKALQKI